MDNNKLEIQRALKRFRDEERLKDNEFSRLLKVCEAVEDDPGRYKQISELLEYVANADLNERKSERFHDRILNGSAVRAISNVGPKNKKVDPDEEFREWLAEESLKPLPDDSKEQSLNNLNELTGLFEPDGSKKQERLDTLEKIRSELVKHLKQKTGENLNAKATRALAALFPRDFTVLVSDRKLNEFIRDFNKAFPTLKINPQGSVPYKHRQVLERLDEFLESSSQDNLELARRMTLPFRLMDKGYLTPEPLSTDESDEMITPQNIILYGPPGTGKTYSTTQRATKLILGKGKKLDSDEIKSQFREYQKEGQIEFVTFHQSYGYEEFVEGLRPVLDDTKDGDVHYELHDGVFKRIALQAAAEGIDFDFLWNQLVAEIKETDEYVAESKGRGKRKGNSYKLSLAPNSDTIQAQNIEDQNLSPLQATRKNSEELWKNCKKDPKALKTNDIPGIVGSDVNRTPMWIVYKCLWELSHSLVKKALDDHVQFKFDSSKQYVLIIDEINRGNMSKILGELVTLLEPDKRLGEDNELILKLPYSQAYFGVPPNLHILGTMNTADRSIALMDVALRRRFKFEELMPDAKVINGNEPLVTLVKDLFNTLNERIRFLYDRDHQLGHAYFLNVRSLEDLRLVFVDRVIPLLQEYFYGDWHKICAVLGCPYNEDGTRIQDEKKKNDSPIVEANKFGEEDTLGFDHDEYEDWVDFEVSEKFLKNKMNYKKQGDEKAKDYCNYLASTFLGVLQLEKKDFDTRFRELTGNGSLSDEKEDGEGESEDNQ